MDKSKTKRLNRIKRHKRLRLHLSGIQDKPRLVVFRSISNIYGQIIDDVKRITIVSSSSIDKDMKQKVKGKNKIEVSKIIGEAIAKKAIDKGIKKLVFDRGGYKYHGRIKSFAEACREAGLDF
ncbi:50S ribosomal protein L18 [candidate division TA06 bacterium]|uniref:Large ribosomal subunit protein uL18 n=1 Tax=candidate division TA06 bacterium TaxID=2250710 RepID=A0A660SPA1_UNCT6|nr:MAG: 50S ribosomal protein L18 [candidate division TA06 bacterium]